MLNWIIEIDYAVQQYVLSTHQEMYIGFWNVLTSLACKEAIIVFALIAMGIFLYKKNWLRTLELLVITIGTAGTVLIMKFLINRVRPIGSFVLETGPSFPSWHAAAAIMFFGFVFFVLAGAVKNRYTRIGMHVLGMILIVLEPISRLALNVHYSSDVLAGLVIGAVWLIFGEKVYQYFERAEPKLSNME